MSAFEIQLRKSAGSLKENWINSGGKQKAIRNNFEEDERNSGKSSTLQTAPAHMKGLRRVHIDKSFVLIFEIVETENKVIFLDFDHHDNIY